MKTLCICTAITALILTTPSCKKETPQPIASSNHSSTASSQIETDINIDNRDGMLYFNDNNELISTVNFLSNLSHEDRLEWNENHNIRTPQSIKDEALISQSALEESLFQNISPGLSFEELSSLGYSPEFSSILNSEVDKGNLVLREDEYGFFSVEPTLENPVASFICNEEGFYIVNDTIVYTSNEFIALKRYEGIADKELLQRADSELSQGVFFFDLQSEERTTHSFYMDNIWGNHGTISNPTWYYDSSTERFKHFVDFESILGSNIYAMTSYFYTEARAEQRRFWIWQTRNKYNPIDLIDGSWSYFWIKLNWNTSQGQYNWNNLAGGTSGHPFPFQINPTGTTNLIATTLNPTGNYFLSSPYAFDVPVWIHSMHIHGYFIGSTGNYHTNYNI
jgi:hypothetical protein